MDSSEGQAGVNRGVDDLPTGKVKAWLWPNVPITVTVTNTNESHNLAHRDGLFQVKLDDKSWSEPESLPWGEKTSFETGLKPLAVRNKGTVGLTLEYQ
jgi:hypothetical protein